MSDINQTGAITPDELDQDEIIDLEEYAKTKRSVPSGQRYRIRIDRQKYVVDVPCMTGREILRLAGKNAQEFMLSQKFCDGHVEKINPDTKVNFTKPGIERFMTLPLDPTEG